MKQTMPLIITISRQFGSGGRYIGQQLAERLNFYYADREIVNKAASQFGVSVEELESQDEKLSSLWDYFLKNSVVAPGVYIPSQIMPPPTSRELFNAEERIIKQIAKNGPAIIIGRSGFHIFREYPNHIKVFLHSKHNSRIQRISELYDIPEKSAAKMINEKDKERALYCKEFTGKEWANATNYDISIDAGKIGVDKTIDFIRNYIEQAGGSKGL